MVNLQVRQFREGIIRATNESQLPIEIKRLVFAEVMKQIEDAADRAIHEELEQARAEAEKKEDEPDEQSVQSD